MSTTQHGISAGSRACAAPLPLRDLRAKMALRGLSVTAVSKAARVPYNTTSGILTGRIIQPIYLQRIIEVIEPTPELQSA